MARVLVGNRKVSVEELCLVALEKYTVELDQATMDALAADTAASPALGGCGCESVARSADTYASHLTAAETRAVMLVRLAGITQRRSGLGPDACQLLADLLNHDICPALPVDDEEGDRGTLTHLACALSSGSGLCSAGGREGVSLAEAMAAAGLSPVPLAAAEFASFCDGVSASAAVAALTASAASALAKTADAVGALSCEAAGAPTDAFAARLSNEYRPHSGQKESALHLRLMLDTSALVRAPAERKAKGGDKKKNKGKKKESKAADEQKEDGATAAAAAAAAAAATVSEHFLGMPQFHGPAHAAADAARRAARVDINSAPAGPSARLPDAGLPDPQPLLAALGAVHSSACVLSVHSAARLAEVVAAASAASAGHPALVQLVREAEGRARGLLTQAGEVARQLAAGDGRRAGLSLLVAVRRHVRGAGRVLAAEALGALHWVGARDHEALEASRENLRRKEEARAKREAEMAAKGKKMKASKKPRALPSGLALGKGTRALRAGLEAAAGGPVGVPGAAEPAAQLRAQLQAFEDALSPDSPALRRQLGELLTSTSVVQSMDPPKGTRDMGPEQMAVREEVYGRIRAVFRRHGAVSIDTPVFEVKELLMGKYGEDTKLIYDLADQGGQMLSLRYDLTVPFARFVARHGLDRIKRFHIGKVYRRDQPAVSKGRFREFAQCDYDVAGAHERMVADADCLTVFTTILRELDVGNFKVKISHRGLLDAVMAVAGVPAEKFRPICSAVDKLDKLPWEEVRLEMVDVKGLAPEAADRLGRLVVNQAGEPREMLARLRANPEVSAAAAEALNDMDLLFQYLDAAGALGHFSFDMSLARGLDYYTGAIFEAVLTDDGVEVGSIGAGGRYDGLISSMNPSMRVPVVGCSVGIERIFNILEKRMREAGAVRAADTDVLVASAGPRLLVERMRVAAELRAAGVSCDYLYHANPKMGKQLDHAGQNGIPLVVVVGEDEVARGVVNLRDMATKEQVTVQRDGLAAAVRARLASDAPPVGGAAAAAAAAPESELARRLAERTAETEELASRLAARLGALETDTVSEAAAAGATLPSDKFKAALLAELRALRDVVAQGEAENKRLRAELAAKKQ